MPNVRDFVTITTTIDTARDRILEWGYPAIIGEQEVSDGAYTGKEKDRGIIKTYYSAEAVMVDMGEGSLYRAAVAAFSQGISRLYAVAIQAAIPGTPTADEIKAGMAVVKDYVIEGFVQGVCLAQIYDKTRLGELKTFCDANGLIFVATNEPKPAQHEEIPFIQETVEALRSKNGFYVAHASKEFRGDVAAAVLGRMMTLKPWVTTFMKDVSVPVDDFFEPADVRALESSGCNVLIKFDDKIRLSNGMTTLEDDPRFIDITRMQYHVVRLIQDGIVRLRINAEKIPYTPSGLETIKTTISSALESLVRQNALASYIVKMPVFDSIDKSDKADRILRGIQVTCTLAGDVQEFAIALKIQV